MRSGSVRSCPRQLPPHLEMTLVYCSRDFSTLRSLYPRQYWSLTTEGGSARDSYKKCKNKYAARCLCHTGLALSSSVAGFGVSLPPVSFLLRVSFVRYLHLRFVGLFVYFVVVVRRAVTIPYVSCSGYGLVPVLSVSCSISFHARSIQISFFVLWLSILLKFIWYGYMITT